MLAHLHVNVLPHTARRRRAIMHFCCKSAHIKLNPFLNNWDYKMRNGHPGFGTEPFTATMSATFLCPARLPLCLRLGRSERPCAPIGIEKASGFRCPIEQFSQRIARKPVSMFQPTFFSATSRTERSSRRCCEMEKDAASSFTEQSESDIRSMNLPAGGIGNRSENETSDWPHKDRLMEYRTCLWNKELYVKHGNLQRPMRREALGGPSSSSTPIASNKKRRRKVSRRHRVTCNSRDASSEWTKLCLAES
jgi:hypothetical protein